MINFYFLPSVLASPLFWDSLSIVFQTNPFSLLAVIVITVSTSLEFGISSPSSRNYSIAFAAAIVISPTHFGTAFLRSGVAYSF